MSRAEPAPAGGAAAFPPLVLVNGPPASGKSVLARHLSDALSLPLVAKDAIKETLFTTVGAPSRERSQQLGSASYELLFLVIGWLIAAGGGAVIDCNWHHGVAEDRLAALLTRARAAVVHCSTSPDETLRRYRRRVEHSERHPGHFDALLLGALRPEEDQRYAPLSLATPTLLVDTSDGYTPDYDTILSFIRRAMTVGA